MRTATTIPAINPVLKPRAVPSFDVGIAVGVKNVVEVMTGNPDPPGIVIIVVRV